MSQNARSGRKLLIAFASSRDPRAEYTLSCGERSMKDAKERERERESRREKGPRATREYKPPTNDRRRRRRRLRGHIPLLLSNSRCSFGLDRGLWASATPREGCLGLLPRAWRLQRERQTEKEEGGEEKGKGRLIKCVYVNFFFRATFQNVVDEPFSPPRERRRSLFSLTLSLARSHSQPLSPRDDGVTVRDANHAASPLHAGLRVERSC